MEYSIIRSKRKTLSLELKNGEPLVRAPKRATNQEIASFVERHRDWLEKQKKKDEEFRKKAQELPSLTQDDIARLRRLAGEYIPKRAQYYAKLLEVDYKRITIRCQKARWGSCSASGNLSFNCLLMLAPEEVIDSVVVHELCHRKHMDHSKEFYAAITSVFPRYPECSRWLKDNGKLILSSIKI